MGASSPEFFQEHMMATQTSSHAVPQWLENSRCPESDRDATEVGSIVSIGCMCPTLTQEGALCTPDAAIEEKPPRSAINAPQALCLIHAIPFQTCCGSGRCEPLGRDLRVGIC